MNHRGANLLFKDFFTEETPVIPIDRKKGRSPQLIEKRNDLLVHRYHFHRTKKIDGKKISYDSLVETVADEFFLSIDTVIDLMIDQHGKLSALNAEWPMDKNSPFGKFCEKKWKHLVW